MADRSPWPSWVAVPVVAVALTGAVTPLDRALLHALVAALLLTSSAWPMGRSAWVIAAVIAAGLVPLPVDWAPSSVDPVATVEALAGWWLVVSWARVAAPALARTPAEVVERAAAWAAVGWAAVGAAHVAADTHALLGVFPVRYHDGAYFAPLVNVQCVDAAGVVNTSSAQTCAKFRYSSFATPSVTVQNQARQSLYQIRLGVRFEF